MAQDIIRVWIDDRHPIFRRGLRTCLSVDEMTVVGESAGLDEALPRSVDVLVFEAGRGGLGRAVARRSEHDVHLVAVVNDDDESVMFEAVDAGVSAVQLRTQLQPDTLVASVRAAARNRTTLPNDLVPKLLHRAAVTGGHHPSALNDREVAVLSLLASGEDTQCIAGALSYSERTVKNVVHDLLMKLNCRNRAHAVAVGTKQGII